MRRLIVADNVLAALPDDFASAFPALEMLDLSGNLFASFPAALQSCLWLEEVVLLRNARLCETNWLEGAGGFVENPPPLLTTVRVYFASASQSTSSLLIKLATRCIERSTDLCVSLNGCGLGDAEI